MGLRLCSRARFATCDLGFIFYGTEAIGFGCGLCLFLFGFCAFVAIFRIFWFSVTRRVNFSSHSHELNFKCNGDCDYFCYCYCCRLGLCYCMDVDDE